MCAVAWPNAFDNGESMPKLTTSAPPLRSSRRVNAIGSPFALRARLKRARRPLDRADDPQVAAAAAEHGVEGALDVGVARIRVLVEQHLRGHQDAVHAVAALRGLLLDERGLRRMVYQSGTSERLQTSKIAV